jgi:two-component system response regulator RegA
MHIVLVDDDETLVRTLSRRLTQHGHQVSGISDSCSAEQLTILRADAYILDLRFGQQSGLHFVTPLRSALPHSRILVMTGFASIATAVQAVKAGADDYLTKPVDFSMLLSSLHPLEATETAAGSDSHQTELLSTDQLEWEHIQRILHEQQGNISQTARLLGMHRRTLQRKLSKHRP